MTARIREFLKYRIADGPCLVVDLDVVRDNFVAFSKALPDSKVFYAVKANPAPEILKMLTALGSCFDVASVTEVRAEMLAVGVHHGQPTGLRAPGDEVAVEVLHPVHVTDADLRRPRDLEPARRLHG